LLQKFCKKIIAYKYIINNKVFRSSIVYFTFNGINAAVPFILLPIITRYLSPEEYGLASIYRTSIDFLIPFIGFNMGMNIDRIFYKVDKKRLSLVIYNMLLILMVTFLLSFLLLLIINIISPKLIGLPKKWIFTLPFAAIGFILMNDFNLVILRDEGKPFIYGFWQIISTIFNLGISIILIIILKFGWEGRAGGILSTFLIMGILSLFYIYHKGYIYKKIDFIVIKDTLKFIIPLVMHSMSAFILFQSSRYIINNLIGSKAVGLFAIAFSFASIVSLFQDALIKAINPWIYKNLSVCREKDKIRIVKVTYIFFILMIMFPLLITAISNILIRLLTTIEYHESIKYVIFIACGFGLNGMYKIVSSYFIFSGKTTYLAIILMISSVIGLFMNYILIYKYGTMGAGYAFLFSLLLCFILTWFTSMKIIRMPWRLRNATNS